MSKVDALAARLFDENRAPTRDESRQWRYERRKLAALDGAETRYRVVSDIAALAAELEGATHHGTQE